MPLQKKGVSSFRESSPDLRENDRGRQGTKLFDSRSRRMPLTRGRFPYALPLINADARVSAPFPHYSFSRAPDDAPPRPALSFIHLQNEIFLSFPPSIVPPVQLSSKKFLFKCSVASKFSSINYTTGEERRKIHSGRKVHPRLLSTWEIKGNLILRLRKDTRRQ